MKPSIFIGFSRDTEELAQEIKSELDVRFSIRLWSESPYEMGSDSLADLVQVLRSFDFAVLVLNDDDFAAGRGEQQHVQVGHLRFVLGLFFGAMGRDRVFFVMVQTMGGQNEHEPDLFGALVTRVEGGPRDTSHSERRKEATHRLSEIITARYEQSHLQMLPSAALAQGYFENFVLPVCRTLVRTKHP
jgi:predicted nucleotide-binding protein